MSDIQRREPIVFAAGDSLIFRRHLPEFPSAAGWSLIYYLFARNGQPTGITFTSTPVTGTVSDYLMDVDDFAATKPAGDYVLAGYALNATTSEQHQIYRASLILTENLSLGKPVKDQVSFEQEMVTELQDGLRRLYKNELQETDVQRVRLIKVRRIELRTELNFWEERLAHRKKLEQIRNTGRNPNSIGPAFLGGW
jgi:hypothetical protein